MVKQFDEISKIVLQYVENLKKSLRIEKVILYGSYAEGRANENSDIDLAIISPDVNSNNLIEYLQLSTRAIPRKIDIDIEPLIFSTDEYNTASSVEFLGDIKKNGKILFDQNGF
ncbi:nucleotidyltransferase domain-containing protein [candidate division KSB1 bacterium]|nr:nucleotidyltransferase domain-containing protein [candidate division KSB1 bacterium]